MNDYDPRRDKHTTHICPRVRGEQLMIVAYDSLSGDSLASPASLHHGKPDAVDVNGQTKRQTYLAATRQDIQYFNAWAEVLNSHDWLTSMTSERIFVKKGQKVRPIDVPPEIKRTYASWVLNRLNLLVKKTAWLLPSIVGFRSVTDFLDYADRKDAITIQDIYASTVWRLIQEHGPWVVFIDLKDAFGNLPHKAINEGLKGLWVAHDDRRRLIETVRVRTMINDKDILKPKNYGIEQGNPLSPAVFNITMSLVARRLKKVGVQMASYGDDVVLVTDSEKAARKALEAFTEVTFHMGFNNVRPLGTEGKATRIYDTSVEPVPLIKTYLVGCGQIALQDEKETALREKLPGGESLAGIKKTNTWKVASKSHLKALIPGENQDSRNPFPVGKGTSPDVRQTKPMEASVKKPRMTRVHNDKDDPLTRTSPYPARTTNDAVAGTLVSTQEASCAKAGSPLNGRMSAADSKDGDGSGAGVTPDHNRGKGAGHRASPRKTVLSITPADIQALVEGRRLRAGDKYRRAAAVVDVRGLHHHVDEDRLPFAVGQIARVCSVHGRVELLVHPGVSWAFDEANFPGLRRISEEPHPDGLVLVYSRIAVAVPSGTARTMNRIEAPDADCIVLATRCRPDNARRWSVSVKANGRVSIDIVTTSCANTRIARVEAIASVLKLLSPESVVIPADGLLLQHLLSDTRVMQVALHDGLNVLRQWSWSRCDEGWLVGRRT